jgi:uncharacterized protein (TIGR03435 family)
MTMAGLGDVLTRIVGTRVRDKTGLEGTYEFAVTYNNQPLRTDPGADTSSGKLDIFGALQSQLGLRLEAQQAPIEVLVIDRIERPTEN